MPGDRPISVLHVSPHPDDELVGAPAILLALRDAGHRVVNLACSLGRPDQHARRAAELERAMELAGFEPAFVDPPLRISAEDDVVAEERRLCADIGRRLREERFAVVVSPTPHDGHHGHEVVGRAVRDALAAQRGDAPPLWWMWSFWGDLPLPTLLVLFDRGRLDVTLRALAAHAGELERSDYAAVLEGRARANRVLGVERVFGFGEPRHDGPYGWLRDETSPFAELLTEAMVVDRRWWIAGPRIPSPADPVAGARAAFPLGWWLDQPSVATLAGEFRAAAAGPAAARPAAGAPPPAFPGPSG